MDQSDEKKKGNEKLWGGRFAQSTDALVEKFNASIDVDKRLYDSDIEGSIAHLKMMAKVAMITGQEADILIAGLGRVKEKIENNEIQFSDSLEDIHMHIEDALGKVCGDVAKKLHPGRDPLSGHRHRDQGGHERPFYEESHLGHLPQIRLHLLFAPGRHDERHLQ